MSTTSESKRSLFWEDLDESLKDPEYYRLFVLEQNRINTTDRVMNQLIDALEASGLTRADIARVVDSQASAVRRLFSQDMSGTNPTLRTLSDVAAVLGFKVELVPMKAEERKRITGALVESAKSARPKGR